MTSTFEPPPRHHEFGHAVNELISAAARGHLHLAKRLTRELGPGSWAMALDRLIGTLWAEPAQAAAVAPELVRACARLWAQPGSALVECGSETVMVQSLFENTEVVLAVGVVGDVDERRRNLINAAARLLSVSEASARRTRDAAIALNSRIVRMIIGGDLHSASAALHDTGGLPSEPVRVWLADCPQHRRPSLLNLLTRLAASDGLVGIVDNQVVAIVSAAGAGDSRLRDFLPTLPRGIRVGVSDPAPLPRCLGAYREAGHAARAGRAVGQSLTSFGDLADQRLIHLIPEEHLLEWAATLMRPILEHPEARAITETLYAWLRAHGRSAVAAGELGLDRRTVDRRVRLAGQLLEADLDDECVRVRLHLAMHALDHASSRPAYGPEPVNPGRDCLVWLLDIETSLEWAASVMKPLREADTEGRLRQTLRKWLASHGDTHGTAKALGIHRNTVTKRLNRVESLTGHSLDYVGNRAELYLALLTEHHAANESLPREAFETSVKLHRRTLRTAPTPGGDRAKDVGAT